MLVVEVSATLSLQTVDAAALVVVVVNQRRAHELPTEQQPSSDSFQRCRRMQTAELLCRCWSRCQPPEGQRIP